MSRDPGEPRQTTTQGSLADGGGGGLQVVLELWADVNSNSASSGLGQEEDFASPRWGPVQALSSGSAT